MKSLAILLISCSPLFGQSPTTTGSGIDWTRPTPASCFAYSNIASGTLFIWLSTCPLNTGNNISQSGGVVSIWNDYSGKNHSFSCCTVGFGTSVAPSYHSTGGSHGGEWVDFSRAGGLGDTLGCTTSLINTNQPLTFFIVHTDTCTSSGNTLFDTTSGNRIWYRQITTGDAFAAPSGVAIAGSKNSGKWMLRTIVYRPTSVSYVRTNGVLMGTANVGTTGTGQIAMGNDISVTTPWRGGMEYFLVYAGELNTNDLQTVENALISEAHITP